MAMTDEFGGVPVEGAGTPGVEMDEFGGVPFKQPDAAESVPPEEPEAGAFWSSKAGRFLQGAGQPVLGVAQMASHLDPTGTAQAYTDRKAAEAEALQKASRQEAGISPDGWDVPGLAGNIAATAFPAAKVLQGLSKAPSMVGAVARGAGLGAAFSAAEPVADPEDQKAYWQTKAGQMGIGALSGAVLGPATETGARVISPIVADKARQLAALGVKMTPGQITGGLGKRAEDILQSLPVVGDYIRDARLKSMESFYRRGADQVLEPLNRRLPPGAQPYKLPDAIESGYDATAYLQDTLGTAFDRTFQGTTFVKDAQFNKDVRSLYAQVRRTLGDDAYSQMKREAANITNQRMRAASKTRGQGAPLTSDQVQGALTTAKEIQRSKMADPADTQRRLARYVGDYRKAMERAVNRQNPGWWDNYQDASKSYAMFTRFQAASRNPATLAHEGMFSPTQLGSAAVAMDPTLRKGAVARGEALMQRYAGLGKDVLPSKVPDSGTPERSFLLGILSGALPAHLAPVAGFGVGVPLVYSERGLDLARRYLLSDSAIQRGAAAGLRRYALPGLTSVAADELNEGYATGGSVEPESPMFDLASVAARANVPPPPSKNEAAWRSFAAGATGGLWPYIEGAGRYAGSYEPDEPDQSFKGYRQRAQQRVLAGKEDFPDSSETAGFAGAMIPLGATTKAGLLPAMGRATGAGALSGYLSPIAPDVGDVSARAPAAGIGALLGGATAGTAGITAGAARNMMAGKAPFSLNDAGLTLGSGLGGMGSGKAPKIGDLTKEEKAALGLDGDPWAHMQGAPQPGKGAPVAPNHMKERPATPGFESTVSENGRELAANTNFGAKNAENFVHPESDLAQWFKRGDISRETLYSQAQDAVSASKSIREFFEGLGKDKAPVTAFMDWAHGKHEPFKTTDRRVRRLMHSVQDAEAAGYVRSFYHGDREYFALTPLGRRASDVFKESKYAQGGFVK